MSKNLYETFQVSQNAEPELIEAAYQFKLSKLDGKSDDSSQNERKLLLWAYQTLIDAEKRSQYDKKLREESETPISSYPDAHFRSDFLDWWGTSKLTATLMAVFLLIGAYMFLDYKKTSDQTNTAKIAVQESSKNENRAIDTVAEINQREQDKFKMELEYRANATEQALNMAQKRQEQQIELQQQQMAMQKQRQEQQIAMQQQQMEQQRIRREQQFYACYNAAWDRFLGDGARARAACAGYK